MGSILRSGLASRVRFSINRSLAGRCCRVCRSTGIEGSIYLSCNANSRSAKSGSYTPRVTSKSSQKLRTSRLTEPNTANCRLTTILLVCNRPSLNPKIRMPPRELVEGSPSSTCTSRYKTPGDRIFWNGRCRRLQDQKSVRPHRAAGAGCRTMRDIDGRFRQAAERPGLLTQPLKIGPNFLRQFPQPAVIKLNTEK